MTLIDKRLLVEECLEIIQEIHKIGAPKIKEEDIEYIQKFNTYILLMEKDLDELDKIFMQLSDELKKKLKYFNKMWIGNYFDIVSCINWLKEKNEKIFY